MRRKDRGFTLVEVMISLTIFAIIAAVLFAILIRNQRSARITGNLVEAQQNARVAIDVLARDIRVAGYGVDIQNEQPAIQYAGPFEIMFSANMVPYPDTTAPRGNPQALDWNGGDLPPHSQRTPAVRDSTGAETIVYTLDYNRDGAINSQDVASGTGDAQASETYNPNDFMLMRQVYGYDAVARRNYVTSEQVALLRGPLPGGQVVEPLFEYWLDTNSDGIGDSLHGDANDDGTLSDAEISSLTPLEWPADGMDLKRIARVTVTATGEMPERDRTFRTNNGYRQVRVTSDVAIGSNVLLPINVVQRLIKGNVYRDCLENQSGVNGEPDWRVQLSGLYDMTDGDGQFEFVVPPGAYTLVLTRIPIIKPGWHVTTFPSDTIRNVDVSVKDTTGVVWYVNSPFGGLSGLVFHDTDRDFFFNSPPDSFFSDTAIKGWDITAWGPIYSAGAPTTDTITQKVIPPDSGYVFTAQDNFFMQDSTYWLRVKPIAPIPYSPIWGADSVQLTMPAACDFDTTKHVPLVATSPPPACSLIALGTIRGGELKMVKWWMEDEDDPCDSLRSDLEYSLDGGAHWHFAKYQMRDDTCIQSMRWFVPPSATDKLYLRLTVNDPDTNNEACVKVMGPLAITYPFMMFPSGLFIIRDQVIHNKWKARNGITYTDSLDPAFKTSFATVTQKMPRQVVINRDTLEEDTAMARFTGPDTLDFTVYWMQDTVRTESETGGRVYSDSALWISEYQDPLGDSMMGGNWRFYLWGNYEPKDTTLTCQVTLLAQIYCIADDGSGPTLIFETDASTTPRLYKRPGIDFIEISHTEKLVKNCKRLMLRIKAVRLDNERTEAKVYFYYNGPSSSYMLTPRVPE